MGDIRFPGLAEVAEAHMGKPSDSAESVAGRLPQALLELPGVVVVCGHYGVGKTTFALNLALDMAQAGRSVTLVDLDVVNPYFRSSDYTAVMQAAGVQVLAPTFAGTAIDAPMVSGRIGTQITQAHRQPHSLVVVDAGGDDAGATALGSFSAEVNAGPYAMLYVANALREQTQHPHDAAALLEGIQAQSKCRATGVVGNTHLMDQTTPQMVRDGAEFAENVAKLLDLPLVCVACPELLKDALDLPPAQCQSLYIMRKLVVTPWDA